MARGQQAPGQGCRRAGSDRARVPGKPPPSPPLGPGLAGGRCARPGPASPRRPAPARPAARGGAARPPRRPSSSPSAAASEQDPELEPEPEPGPERGPQRGPKLEPALRRTERSAAAKPIARYNRTSYFYPTFSESSEHSHLLVSPVLVASAVIGVVIILSCITIIVGSIRRDRQARLQRHRHRHHHHHHRRRHREYEHGYVSEEHAYSRSSRRMRYTCSPVEDWPPPLDVSSDGDVDATVLRELYPDSPPGYEECVGPGATELYVPTDAPPPYSLTGSCPTLDSVVDASSGQDPSQSQQVHRPEELSGLHTTSMDMLPPYEAVCGAGPPSGLLPLPGPGPGPRSSQSSPDPSQGSERTV